MYLVTVMGFGVMALVIGIPLGALGAYAMGGFMASMMNFDVTNFVPPVHVLLIQTVVGVGVPLLAALWPILSGTRVTAREAMSAHGTGKGAYGRGLVDRLLERVRGLSRPLLLSLRNTFRRKGRLALTLVTLTLGGSIFIAVFSVRESTVLTLDDALGYFKYDVSVNFRKTYREDFVVAEALNVPGVAAAESPLGASARRLRPNNTEGNAITVLALPHDTAMIKPILIEGRWLKEGDENALVLNTVVTQDEPDVKVGDWITLTIDGREKSWKVVGIVRGVMTGPIAYANKPYFEREMRAVGRSGMVWVALERNDPASRKATMDAISAHFKERGVNVGSMEAMADTRDMIQGQFDLLIIFLMVMAILMAAVGGLGLMGTMSLNVIERTREIGVMRAIGASDGAVRRIFVVEGVLIGVISWLVGTLIAMPISQALSLGVGVSLLQAPLSYRFSLLGVAIWLVVVIVLALLASILPAWNASRLSVREVLAYE
jgi:putative ABC transport system permease protein